MSNKKLSKLCLGGLTRIFVQDRSADRSSPGLERRIRHDPGITAPLLFGQVWTKNPSRLLCQGTIRLRLFEVSILACVIDLPERILGMHREELTHSKAPLPEEGLCAKRVTFELRCS